MKKLMQNIFSIRNDGMHKVIIIFGLKIKFLNIKFLKKKIEKDGNDEIPEVLKGGDTTVRYLKKYITAYDRNIDIEISDKFQNVIWQFWAQGKEDMPDIVRVCINSVKRNNPHRQVILLTNENLNEYVQLPGFICKKYAEGKVSVQHFSDIIRTCLLFKYGGTWVDATIYMSDRIPDAIENSSFFVFKEGIGNMIDENMGLEEFMILSNIGNYEPVPITSTQSFIHASAPNNAILKGMLNLLFAYWEKEDKAIHYLFWHYFLTTLIFYSRDIKLDFMNIPYIPCEKYCVLQKIMFNEFDKEKFRLVLNLSPIHKLWKTCKKDDCKYTYINHLLEDVHNL